MEREILFEVRKGTAPDSHRYVVYTNGETEGFGDGTTIIVNGYPALLRRELAVAQAASGL